MNVIDAHSHLPLDADAADALDRAGISVVNICVASGQLGGLDSQRAWYRKLAADRPGRFAWITSFPLDGFGTAGWAEACITGLNADLNAGACGVKVWKNVGMELRDPETGGWVLCDDGRFDPIYEHLAGRGVAVLMHIGEPLACWTSLAEMERQGSPHLGYYRNNPQWHWHGRADVPSHAQLMAARDRVMEKHPSLTVVGAHYGSHEYDLAEVAERFDRYPNYRVDTSGRLGDLALRTAEDRDGVRDFHRRYADRILWGIDWVMSQPLSGRPKVVDALLDRYDRERRFYETGETLDFGGSTVRGLDLSDDVLAAVRCETATKTYGVFKD